MKVGGQASEGRRPRSEEMRGVGKRSEVGGQRSEGRLGGDIEDDEDEGQRLVDWISRGQRSTVGASPNFNMSMTLKARRAQRARRGSFRGQRGVFYSIFELRTKLQST